MNKLILYCLLLAVSLIWAVPSQAASTYNATGYWAITETFDFHTDKYVPATVQSFTTYINQVSADPYDYWEISTVIDGVMLPPLFTGHVYDNLYEVESTPYEWPDGVPVTYGDFFEFASIPPSVGPGVYVFVDYEYLNFTIADGGNAFIGASSFYCNGWATNLPYPDGDLIYNPAMFEMSGTSTITMTRIVPIPGALWLLGTGIIGLVGLKRKLRAA